MRIFQSVFLNDTHDHDTRDTKADFVLVKSEEWERFVNRNERILPLQRR